MSLDFFLSKFGTRSAQKFAKRPVGTIYSAKKLISSIKNWLTFYAKLLMYITRAVKFSSDQIRVTYGDLQRFPNVTPIFVERFINKSWMKHEGSTGVSESTTLQTLVICSPVEIPEIFSSEQRCFDSSAVFQRWFRKHEKHQRWSALFRSWSALISPESALFRTDFLKSETLNFQR